MAWRNKKKDKFVQQNSGRSDWSEDVKDENKTDLRLIETQAVEAIDAKYGFERINKDFGREEVGYVIKKNCEK
jgi:hypothetical protein